LAVEDAVQQHQRPKVDRYASHLFVTAYAVAFDMATGELTVREIDAFVTPNALVTVRKSLGFDIDAVIKHWDQSLAAGADEALRVEVLAGSSEVDGGNAPSSRLASSPAIRKYSA